ncbi:MAG: preprotein translocase subunit SecG [Bacteroidota bacterium]|nr:preprotein translocase subunit SecG [Bacteroidota bacterium]
MIILFVILIVIAALFLGFFVLVQNPKGGGLSGNIAGFSTQFMGVKQTTDVLERGTWIFGTVVALLCLFSVFFIQGGSSNQSDRAKEASGLTVPAQASPTPAATLPAPTPTQPTK